MDGYLIVYGLCLMCMCIWFYACCFVSMLQVLLVFIYVLVTCICGFVSMYLVSLLCLCIIVVSMYLVPCMFRIFVVSMDIFELCI